MVKDEPFLTLYYVDACLVYLSLHFSSRIFYNVIAFIFP